MKKYFVALALFLGCTLTKAATFYVTDISDSGPGTLRAAILEANAAPDPPHRIEFAASFINEGMVELLQTLPVIEVPLIIDGAGKDPMIGSWEPGYNFPLLRTRASLSLIGLSMWRGVGEGVGGCVHAEHVIESIDLNIDSVTFNSCLNLTSSPSAFTRGGAVNWSSSSGEVLIRDSRFEYNDASNTSGGTAQGGAIYAAGPLSIERSFFNSNQVNGGGRRGGAIFALAHGESLVTIQKSVFINNSLERIEGVSSDSMGGAVSVDCFGCRVIMEGNYFEGNQAQSGGAVFLRGNTRSAETLVANSTFISNVAKGAGGAIYSNNALLVIKHATFDSNFAVGGGHLYTMLSHIDELSNSVLGEVASGSGAGCFFNSAATIANGTYYPSSMAVCQTGLPGAEAVADFQVMGVDRSRAIPVLVFSHQSPVIDGGSNDLCLPVDAHDTARPQDGNDDGIAVCDAGAYELVLADRIFRNGFEE